MVPTAVDRSNDIAIAAASPGMSRLMLEDGGRPLVALLVMLFLLDDSSASSLVASNNSAETTNPADLTSRYSRVERTDGVDLRREIMLCVCV